MDMESASKSSTKKAPKIIGLFEAEAWCGDELALQSNYLECKKNPGHKQFIPANEFQINNLPEEYQDEDIMSLVKALSDITVRITIRHTSDQRPKTYEGSDKPYPFYDQEKTKQVRTGSGWVWRVNLFSSSLGKKCPCRHCSISPVDQWAVIDVYTVSHLVFDDKEAKSSTCHFFYDESDMNINYQPLVTEATEIVISDEGDTCRLTYITHDMDLAIKLRDMWELYKKLHIGVGEKYNIHETGTTNKLVIIVSHPHGLSKQISVGEYTDITVKDGNDAFVAYTYTTPTCKGSSGAPVYVLGRWWWWGCDHPHSGQLENSNLNYSGVAMYQ